MLLIDLYLVHFVVLKCHLAVHHSLKLLYLRIHIFNFFLCLKILNFPLIIKIFVQFLQFGLIFFLSLVIFCTFLNIFFYFRILCLINWISFILKFQNNTFRNWSPLIINNVLFFFFFFSIQYHLHFIKSIQYLIQIRFLIELWCFLFSEIHIFKII